MQMVTVSELGINIHKIAYCLHPAPRHTEKCNCYLKKGKKFGAKLALFEVLCKQGKKYLMGTITAYCPTEVSKRSAPT